MLRVAAILAAALLATIDVACFSKPDAPQLGRDGGGPQDGASQHMDTASADPDALHAIDASTCMTIANFDANGTGCPSGFLAGMTGTSMTTTGGTLTFTVTNGGTANCATTATYNFAGGMSVDIDKLSGNGAQASFMLAVQGGQKTIEFRAGGQWFVVCPDTTPHAVTNAAGTPFSIRIIGDGATNESLSVQLATGGTYATIYTCPPLVGSAGAATPTLAGSGSSGTATISFDNLQACQ